MHPRHPHAALNLALWILMSFALWIARPAFAISNDVHACSGAGKWFPADPAELRTMIEGFLAKAETPKIDAPIRAIVVPHAGYVYSGATAAYAYKTLQGRSVHRVIILAFNHGMDFEGASVPKFRAYETPLGSVPVDAKVVEALLKAKGFQSIAAAHLIEHSDENQIPFLQCVLKDFRIVPIQVGRIAWEDPEQTASQLEGLAKAIRPWLDDQTVLVVSSDFTHYGASYGYQPFRQNPLENLRQLDGEGASYLIHRDLAGFLDFFNRSGATICGRAPLALALKVLGEGAPGVFLHYDRSGGEGGVYNPSVGYMALAFPAGGARDGPTSTTTSNPDWLIPAGDRGTLGAGDQKTLLRLARDVIARQLEAQGANRIQLSDYEITPRLMAGQGAFVTLKIGEDLRGCIGSLTGESPLYASVARMALQAAFRDPRFSPLRTDELPRVRFEISALLTPDDKVDRDPMKPLPGIDQIRLGQDGLMIRKGMNSGLLLPQVPVEQGWNRDQFLEHLCEKAGLPAGAWKDAELKRFGAQVFGETQ